MQIWITRNACTERLVLAHRHRRDNKPAPQTLKTSGAASCAMSISPLAERVFRLSLRLVQHCPFKTPSSSLKINNYHLSPTRTWTLSKTSVPPTIKLSPSATLVFLPIAPRSPLKEEEGSWASSTVLSGADNLARRRKVSNIEK